MPDGVENNGGNAGGNGNNGGGGGEQTVPYSRFQEVVKAKNTAEARVTTLEGEVTTWQTKAATVDTVAAELEQWKGKYSEAETRFQTFQTIASAGITDPELVEATQWAYSRLPEKDRPAMGDWLGSIKADPAKAPVVLRPHFQGQGGGQQQASSGQQAASQGQQQGAQQASQQQGAQGGQGGQQRQTVNANGGVQPHTGTQQPFSAEQIARMDPATYKAHREAIMKQKGWL